MNYLSPRTHFSLVIAILLWISQPPLFPLLLFLPSWLCCHCLFGYGFFWDSLSIMTITVNYALLELFPRIWRAPSWHTGKDNSCWSPGIHQEQGQFIRERESSETPQAMTDCWDSALHRSTAGSTVESSHGCIGWTMPRTQHLTALLQGPHSSRSYILPAPS